MKDLKPTAAEAKRTNKKITVGLVTTLLAFLLMSCSDRSVNNDREMPPADEIVSTSKVIYPGLLSSGSNAGSSFAAKSTRTDEVNIKANDEFTSPLFGLGLAPNGDILVADAGAGVANMYGTTEIPFPGITDVSPLGRGVVWATRGLTGGEGEDTGQGLYRLSKGEVRHVADLFSFESANDPDEGEVDSNPFDVQGINGNRALVADAGANDLLRVNNRGHVEVVAIFPMELVSTENVKSLVGCPGPSELCDLPDELPAQPVPTSIAIGPDGYIYVGELKGFPAPTGESNIWRIAPDAKDAVCGSSPDCVKVFDGGFTSIIDLAFGPDGKLYVAELDEQSWFAVEVLGGGTGGTVNVCDLDAMTSTEVATGIPILTAIAFGKDGRLWATRNALIPGSAEVVEVQ